MEWAYISTIVDWYTCFMKHRCSSIIVVMGLYLPRLGIKKRKKNSSDFKCTRAYAPWLCNFTWPQHTLQMFVDHYSPRQTTPLETIDQGLMQPQRELYPIQTIFNHRSRDQLLEFCTSFYETISCEFLVQRNFKHTQFSQEHWYWRDSNLQSHAPKASTVSIELTWLLLITYWSVM